MKWDAKALTLAIAIVTAAWWVFCSVFVALLPGPAMAITGQMIHADLSEWSWSLTWVGFWFGLASWTICAGVTAWILAWTYNRFGSA